jgi:hypothetical protein
MLKNIHFSYGGAAKVGNRVLESNLWHNGVYSNISTFGKNIK